MKELILRATLAAVHRSMTLAWICTQLSQLVREPEAVPGVMPHCLLSRPQAEELQVWLKDTAESPDPRFCRYRRLLLRPLEITSSPLPDTSVEAKIAVGLLPAAWLYMASPLDSLLREGLEPRQVMADGRVVTMEELTPAQMRRMEQLYAVADDGLLARLHVSLHLPAPPGVRPNHYAELEREVELLLAECFRPEGEAQGCPLRLPLQLCDVHPGRLHSIAPEHRQLLFGDRCTAYDPRCAFPEHGACVPVARRKLRLVMLYPAGGVETARKLCRLLQSLTGITAVFPLDNEEQWIEYEVKDDVVARLKQSLLLLKQRNYQSTTDLLVCYISPSGKDAETAMRLQLHAHVSFCCRNLELLCMDSIPQKAVESGKLGKYAHSLASRLVVKLKGLSWMPQQLATQDTDLILCLSHSARRHSLLCGATFCSSQQASRLHHFVCEERHLMAFLHSDIKQAYVRFMEEHGGQPPQRIVVYAFRNVDERHVVDFAALLARLLPRLRVVTAFLRLTGADYPGFYDPSSPCCMPPDGTWVSCPDDAYLLFCNDFRPDGTLQPARYPHPLEVRLRHLDADGSFTSVTPPEAEVLMTQVYQLTCLNPERVERCVVPAIALKTSEMVRRAHNEHDALATYAAATSMDGGGVAEWRSGEEVNVNNVLM